VIPTTRTPRATSSSCVLHPTSSIDRQCDLAGVPPCRDVTSAASVSCSPLPTRPARCIVVGGDEAQGVTRWAPSPGRPACLGGVRFATTGEAALRLLPMGRRRALCTRGMVRRFAASGILDRCGDGARARSAGWRSVQSGTTVIHATVRPWGWTSNATTLSAFSRPTQ
jgi:hypothetical protein